MILRIQGVVCLISITVPGLHMGKLKKIVATLVAVATVGALSVGAFASYTYGTIFKDTITSKTSQAFDLGTHSYTGNDIGANNIHVTAPSRVDYYLELYVDSGFLGIYNQYGSSVECDTDGGTSKARLRIDRTDSSTTSLGGYVESRTRTWQ